LREILEVALEVPTSTGFALNATDSRDGPRSSKPLPVLITDNDEAEVIEVCNKTSVSEAEQL
jgi:hypothetical protein